MNEQNQGTAGQEPRRNFLVEFWSLAIGGLITVIPCLAGLAVFLDPLRRNRGEAGENWIRVASLEAVPDDGVPRKFPVITDSSDAWTYSAAERVGAVYLSRSPGTQEVKALNVVCPHAGCFVVHDESTSEFRCPCHTSSFTLAGDIIKPSPSPRGMDALETRATDDGGIEVKFVNYYPGRQERIVKK